jgi:hypothetical protein
MMKTFYATILCLLGAVSASATCTHPVISSPVATPDSTGQQITFTWTTNVAADSEVSYGWALPTTFTPITDTTSGVTSHSVTVTGLFPSTPYGWFLRSRAVDAGTVCTDYHYYGFYESASVVTTNAAPAGSADYYLSLQLSPQHVTQGSGVYLRLWEGYLVGTLPLNTLKVVVTGLPNSVALTWTDSQVFGSGESNISTTTVTNDTITLRDGVGPGWELYILTNQGGTTTPGTYTLTFTGSGTGLPTHVVTWNFVVDAASSPFGIAFPSGTPSSYPPIPALSNYLSNAAIDGAYNCAQDTILPRTIRPNSMNQSDWTPVSGAFQRGSWYYDGVRVYYNIGDMLNDQTTYQQCIANINQVYRDNEVIFNNGGIPGFISFTQGSLIDYQRTGTAADLTSINDLDLHSGPNPSNGTTVPVAYLQREVAYAFKTARDAVLLGQNNPRLGQTSTWWRNYYLEHILGHIDEICLSGTAGYVTNFMSGLDADALITYYERGNHDPRIPSAIKCLADYYWNNQWNNIASDTNAFSYDTFRNAMNENPLNSAASYFQDLNLLFAPMYAWLFKMTGLTQYQTEGDTIFQHGVLLDGPIGGPNNEIGANNGPPNGNSGKAFSQVYMWGPSYVTWRSAPSTGTGTTGKLEPPVNPSAVIQ